MTAEGSSLTNKTPLTPAGGALVRGDETVRPAPSGMGALLRRFPGRGIDRLAWITRGIPGLILCAGSLGYGAWRWYYGYTRFGTIAAETWSRPYLLVGALFAALLALWLIQRRSLARRFVELYENGVLISIQPRKVHRWQWKEIGGLNSGSIESVFFGLPLSRKNWLTFYPKTGKPVLLDDRIQDLSSLTRELKPLFYSYRMPALRSTFYADRWISFGPLAVHRQAVRVKNKLYPWKLVKDISMQAGTLVITIDGVRAFRFPTRKIPNLELMISIIQEGVIS